MLPFFQIGGIAIPSYFFMISIGCFAGLFWFLRRTPADEEAPAVNMAIVGLISGFVGARLLHVVFEEPALYLHDPLKILQIWQGGFVFYGGLICGLLGAAIYVHYRRLEVPVWLDRASLPIALAYAIGRIGCFANGCCYGRICFMPWAVRFPSHALWGMSVQPRHPTQLYAAGLELVIILFLDILENKKIFAKPGRLFCTWMILHGINRILMEHWRDDDRGADILGMSLSTVISFGLIIGAYLYLRSLLRKPAT